MLVKLAIRGDNCASSRRTKIVCVVVCGVIKTSTRCLLRLMRYELIQLADKRTDSNRRLVIGPVWHPFRYIPTETWIFAETMLCEQFLWPWSSGYLCFRISEQWYINERNELSLMINFAGSKVRSPTRFPHSTCSTAATFCNASFKTVGTTSLPALLILQSSFTVWFKGLDTCNQRCKEDNLTFVYKFLNFVCMCKLYLFSFCAISKSKLFCPSSYNLCFVNFPTIIY